MMPVVFRLPFFDRAVPSFGLMMMIGFLVSVAWAARRAAKSKADADVVLNCAFIALFGGVIGCRLMYVWHNWNEFGGRGSVGQVLYAIVDVTKGGLEFYGGFILTVVGILAYLAWKRLSLRWYLDMMAPSAALGLAFGRIGCFLNGCCWGTVCSLPWAITFPYGSNPQIQHWQAKLPGAELPQQLVRVIDGGGALEISRESIEASDAQIADALAAQKRVLAKLEDLAPRLEAAKNDPAHHDALMKEQQAISAELAAIKYLDLREQMARYNLTAAELKTMAMQHTSLHVHPAQLYSAFNALLIALLLSAWYWRRTRDGQVTCLLFIVEPITRWFLEVVRDDNPIDTFGFTISQFLAMCMVAAGVIGLIVVQRMSPRSPRAVEWTPPPEETSDVRGGKGSKPARA